MNPLAEQLNENIKSGNSHVYDMLSGLGKEIYFPKEGILSQSPVFRSDADRGVIFFSLG